MKDEVEKLLTIKIGQLMIRKNSDGGKYPNVGEIVEKIMPTIAKAQVEAVRAELERVILGSTPPYLTDGDLQDGWNHGVAKYKENLLMKAGLLAQPSKLDRLARLNTEGDEWETEPLSPEEVLKVQEETDREIRSE